MSNKFSRNCHFVSPISVQIRRSKVNLAQPLPAIIHRHLKREKMMPRFYFHLIYNETRIADDVGKKFETRMMPMNMAES